MDRWKEDESYGEFVNRRFNLRKEEVKEESEVIRRMAAAGKLEMPNKKGQKVRFADVLAFMFYFVSLLLWLGYFLYMGVHGFELFIVIFQALIIGLYIKGNIWMINNRD